MNVEKLLGECEMMSCDKDCEGIIKKTGEILKSDPANRDALSYRAMALYHLERYDESLGCIDEILETDSGNHYYQYIKVKVLIRLDRVNDAYEFYEGLGDNDPDKETIESLAHALIDIGEYEKALKCLDTLNESNWLFSYRIVDGYKRIENLSDLNLEGRYDEMFRMSWIGAIKSKSDEQTCPLCGGNDFNNQFSFCNGCGEEINMDSMGTRIECDSMQVYYYICDKLMTVKEFLKSHASLTDLHKEMDCLDDVEFDAFINHLKDIGYVVEASEGYIFDGDSMATSCEEGKYAAPRWLVFPGYSPGTIGWRMGAGEDYCMNEPHRDRLFSKIFPQPKNWLFNPRNPKFQKLGRFPFLAAVWDEDLNPKYSEISQDAVDVSGFITPGQEGEFQVDAHDFTSIEHAILFSKIASYNRLDPYNVTFDELKNDFTITDEQLAHWEMFKFTVCLNACYYRVMNDDGLKERLLATGDSCLVYTSDDEWGGEDNLFGFALMQVRDEMRRLYENEDLIDWKYTEYLKHAYPYVKHERDPNDRQSAEYRVVESVLSSASRYVRDANLKDEIAGKYKAGQIITEKAFVDASNRIGGMVTSHRYLILSGYMADFSPFEDKTNWGLHVAKNGSKFKVLDIFTVEDKTQILLLQLPDAFESAFVNRTDVEEEFIERERENFNRDLKSDVISDLADEMWLERCSFPIGMDDEGEFFK